jgi:hypothetical protein
VSFDDGRRDARTVALLNLALDRLVVALTWVRRQLRRLAVIAFVAGLVNVLLLLTVSEGAAIVFGALTLAALAAPLWYRHRIHQFVAAVPELRAELGLVSDLPPESRLALAAAADELQEPSMRRRLHATEVVSDQFRAAPLTTRAAIARRQLIPAHIGLVGWAALLTLVLVVSIPAVMLVALVA